MICLSTFHKIKTYLNLGLNLINFKIFEYLSFDAVSQLSVAGPEIPGIKPVLLIIKINLINLKCRKTIESSLVNLFTVNLCYQLIEIDSKIDSNSPN